MSKETVAVKKDEGRSAPFLQEARTILRGIVDHLELERSNTLKGIIRRADTVVDNVVDKITLKTEEPAVEKPTTHRRLRLHNTRAGSPVLAVTGLAITVASLVDVYEVTTYPWDYNTSGELPLAIAFVGFIGVLIGVGMMRASAD